MHVAIMMRPGVSTVRSRSRAATVALALAITAAACADHGRAANKARDDDPFRVAVTSSPRVLAHHGVDAPVVLVTIDGVRWQEIFAGTDSSKSKEPVVPAPSLVPNLYKLGGERGAFIGAPGRGTIAASGPNYVSLPGYNEILSGRPPYACHDNDCARTIVPTILDESREAGAKVAAFASWERLELAATAKPEAFFLSCGRHGDAAIDPSPGNGDYRPDRITADAALAYYEKEQPDVFFLGLGDPDEYAHRGDYAGYVRALRHADDVVGRLVSILERTGERGRRTHIVVTADHGRAKDFSHHGAMPEAARVWMVASGPRFFARGSIASLRERRLADIAPTLRMVLGLGVDASDRSGTAIDELFESADFGQR